MHYLYILRSNDSGKYYIGETAYVEKRLLEHKAGKSSFGRRNKNLVVVYKKEFDSRSGAKEVESFLKRQKSHSFIDKFVTGKVTLPCSSVGRARGCARAKRVQMPFRMLAASAGNGGVTKRVNSGKAHAANPEPSPDHGKVQRLDTRCLQPKEATAKV